MSVKTFAAIDVGSYELSMKIFEFNEKKGSTDSMKEIDHVRHRIELGTETYKTGKISYTKVDELCKVLLEFTRIMKSYQVNDYKAYATSAIREMKNRPLILDQIRQRTGIRIEVLSNSEQRFLDFKSVAFQGKRFDEVISKTSVIVDVGGGSIQFSLFEKGSLVATQNFRLGILRIREMLQQLNLRSSQYTDIINELVDSKVSVLSRLYLKDKAIENIVIVDEYISGALIQLQKKGSDQTYLSAETYESYMDLLQASSTQDLCRRFHIPEESVFLLQISSVLVQNLIRHMKAENVWIPGVTLCDGMAYEYGEQKKLILPDHDFEKDIISCVQNISKRYKGSPKRGETLERISLTIFDRMKKYHGLGGRERLILALAARLHDCGRYITMNDVGQASYEIITSTEIIGLSSREHRILANVVQYNYLEFTSYEEQEMGSALDAEEYAIVAKLTAILRLATGLDRSHKEKFRNVTISFHDRQMILTVDTDADITLEKGLFYHKVLFFEEIYSITPVIKRKKHGKR